MMKEEFDILWQIKKKEQSVPDGYFEQLHQSVMDSVAKENLNQSETKVFKLNFGWIAAAASIVLFLTMHGLNNMETNPPNEIAQVSNETDSEADYIDFLVDLDDLEISDIDIDIEEF